MTRPFGLNGESVEHARLADREIADIDHLLHFAFPLREDFPGLEGDKLTELVFEFAQGVAQSPHRFAAHRARRYAPFRNAFCARAIVAS